VLAAAILGTILTVMSPLLVMGCFAFDFPLKAGFCFLIHDLCYISFYLMLGGSIEDGVDLAPICLQT
jgi:hypothetical protein